MLQAARQLAAQLFMRCCTAVDAKAGSDLLALDQELDASCSPHMQALVSPTRRTGPLPAREAAVEAALEAWRRREDILAPELRRAVFCAGGLAVAPSGSPGRTVAVASKATLQATAASRDVACTAAGWCANLLCQRLECNEAPPLPGREPAGGAMQRCAACRAVRYCRWG